jgi:hypothetical protein
MARMHMHMHMHMLCRMRMQRQEHRQAGGRCSTSDLRDPRHPLQHQAVQPAQHLLPQQRLRLALIQAVVLQALRCRWQGGISDMNVSTVARTCAFARASERAIMNKLSRRTVMASCCCFACVCLV